MQYDPNLINSIVCHSIYSHDLSNDDLSAQAVTKGFGFFSQGENRKFI